MKYQRLRGLPWGALLPVILAACGPVAVSPPRLDGGSEASVDVPTDAPGEDVVRDTGRDTPPTTDVPDQDSGLPPEDSGLPPEDSGTPPEDTGTPPEDSGTPPEDTGEPPMDTGVPLDTGEPPMDTGVPPTDVPPGTCTLPLQRALTLPSDRVMATLSGMSRVEAASCASAGGPEHLYPLRVAARTGLLINTTASLDTVLSVRRTCGDVRSEVACNDDVNGSNNAVLRRMFDPGDYFVVVDQFGTGGTGGAYTLDVTAYTPAANAECAGALALNPGTPVAGNTASGGAQGTACLGDAWGPQLFYTLRVPAGQRAAITALPTGTPSWRAAVRVTGACASTGCVGGAVSASDGASAVTRVDNRGSTSMDVTVSVASTSARTGGPFTLSAVLEGAPPPPANASCASARAVAHGARVTGEDPSLGTTRLTASCLPGAQGAVLYYRATVGGRHTLVVTATPTGRWDPAVRLFQNCTATACLASSNASGAGDTETLTYTNPGASPQDVVIAVGGTEPSAAGPFELGVSILPPPTNTTCSEALTVPPGTRLTTQNAAAGTENATGACLPSATGTVLYYRVGVPAGQTLNARVTPATGMDATVRLLNGCSASACLASTNTAGAGAPETLSFTNTLSTDRIVILAVGGLTNATNGIFDLSVSTAREYAETTTPRACDDMTGGTVLTALTGDDAVTGLLDLPFPFVFFGERELEYAVSTNGLLQLFPSLTGTAANGFDNQPIPTAEAPNGFIAALWDDLFVETGGAVTTRTFGAAPNRHFTVQWAGMSFYGDRTARLTFQARLFETTNVIELHYCTLTPGMMAPLATGSSATVGLESPRGTEGREHSHNAAMSVGTTNGLRFTP